jgi:hypothetical protein
MKFIVNSNQQSLIGIAVASNIKKLIASYRWIQIESSRMMLWKSAKVTPRRKQSRIIPPYSTLSPRGPRSFLQRYLQSGTADITGNLLRNSDRQSSFWRCREHTDAKVSTESTSIPSSAPDDGFSRSPFRSLFLLIPLHPPASPIHAAHTISKRRECSLALARSPSLLYALRDENASKFREDGPTLIRYWFTLHTPIDYLSLRYLYRDLDDGSVRIIRILFARPKNDLENLLKWYAKSREYWAKFVFARDCFRSLPSLPGKIYATEERRLGVNKIRVKLERFFPVFERFCSNSWLERLNWRWYEFAVIVLFDSNSS